MHNQVRVCVRDRGLHVQKQSDALVDAQPLLVAKAIDVASVYVLEHEVWLSRVRDARVDEPGDVRMREPRQYGPFALEPLFAAASHQSGVQQLQRDLAFEAPVAA